MGMGGKVGAMTADETAVFHRLRDAEAKKIGAVRQRAGGMDLMMARVAEAKRMVADEGK